MHSLKFALSDGSTCVRLPFLSLGWAHWQMVDPGRGWRSWITAKYGERGREVKWVWGSLHGNLLIKTYNSNIIISGWHIFHFMWHVFYLLVLRQVAHSGLKLSAILLDWPPMCWDYKQALPHSALAGKLWQLWWLILIVNLIGLRDAWVISKTYFWINHIVWSGRLF